MGERRVTQKDLAAQVGLSQAGVSMALRGDPRIGQATQAKVRAAAAALGYRPDPVLGALADYRAAKSAPRYTGNIALLLPCRKQSEYLRSPFAAGVIAGVREGCASMGYRCEEVVLGRQPWARTMSILRSRGIRGMVIGPVGKDAPEAPPIEGLAIVQIGRGWATKAYPRVTTNHFDNLRLAWEVLQRRGYGRIGLLLRAGNDLLTGGRWVAAFQYLQGRSGGVAIPVCENSARIKSWIRQWRPDAIIASDQWLRSRLRETCQVEAPADIGFVALGVPGGADATAGVFQRPQEIGRVATRQLDLSLRRYDDASVAEPIVTVINGEWHEGDSVRPRESEG